MRCPNCDREFPHGDSILVHGEQPIEAFHWAAEEAPKLVVLRSEPFPCPHCPAMIKTSDRYRMLHMYERLPILLTILLGMPLVLGTIVTISVIGNHYSQSALFLGLPFLALSLTPILVSTSVGVRASVQMRHMNRWEVASMRHICQCCGTIAALDDAEFCSVCGASIPPTTIGTITSEYHEARKPGRKIPKSPTIGTCLVCDLEMNEGDFLASCPHCGNIFHKAHLANWVRTKKHCPVCGERLAESGIIIVPNEESTREDSAGGAP